MHLQLLAMWMHILDASCSPSISWTLLPLHFWWLRRFIYAWARWIFHISLSAIPSGSTWTATAWMISIWNLRATLICEGSVGIPNSWRMFCSICLNQWFTIICISILELNRLWVQVLLSHFSLTSINRGAICASLADSLAVQHSSGGLSLLHEVS